jgi:hypothetical protein
VSARSTSTAGSRPRARGRRTRTRWVGAWLLRLVALVVVFLAGLVVGRALEDAPNPGGTQTIVRTLTPLTVEPQERTVTVTTSGE